MYVCVNNFVFVSMFMRIYIYIYTHTPSSLKNCFVERHTPKPKRLGGGLALRQAVLATRSL